MGLGNLAEIKGVEPVEDPIASYFSNPDSKYRVGAGDQRGDSKWNDAYMFLTVKVTYKLFSVHRGRSKF